MSHDPFDNELSTEVWRNTYRYRDPVSGSGEASIQQTWRRVARAVSSVETERRAHWQERFYEMLEGQRFLPGGRILASAGTAYDATLFNCFVMGGIEDSLHGIFRRLEESALTMQKGGGIGCDFSTLRPAGTAAVRSGRTASGPVSFMRLWNSMCTTLLSTGSRRGAMMGVLRCDHPDIFEFIAAKRDAGALTNFNLSVLVTDSLLAATKGGGDWPLVFPAKDRSIPAEAAPVRRTGFDGAAPAEVHARVRAGDLWQRIIEAAYETAEPGVLFIDRINQFNNLHYREQIAATNPCGEIPLPPFGACDLGSINLAACVESPFTEVARFDMAGIACLAGDATRFLDDVIDLSTFPLREQAVEARATRRVGLGVTGLADALVMLGLHYDSDAARSTAVDVLRVIRDAAYRASVRLAEEKGAFPEYSRDPYLSGGYVGALPTDLRDEIAAHGIRNSHLLAIAPAGSISVLANNVSSGIEPVFAADMVRFVVGRDGERVRHEVADHACARWRRLGNSATSVPEAFVTARELSPEAHLSMVAGLQALVDSSISKTVNVAPDISRRKFQDIYQRAFDLGLKGCTVFRPNPARGEVLAENSLPDTRHCCIPEREGD